MTQLTLATGEVIEAELHEFMYVGGAARGEDTLGWQSHYRGRKINFNDASAKIVRDDIRRRSDEWERKQELKEIIWAS